MSIPLTSVFNAEIIVLGQVASGGSSSRVSNFSFHYKRTAGSSSLTKAALDTIFQSSIVVPLAALLNARWTQTGNTIRWIDDATDPPNLTSHAVVGSIAGDSMSTVLASFMLLQTGIRGKSYRGSKHLFPLSESDSTSGTDDILNAAALARYATLKTALLAPIVDSNGNTWYLNVLSRKLSQLRVNPTTVVANQVTTIGIGKRIGRMRHREVKSVY